jgi:hypothetical protein
LLEKSEYHQFDNDKEKQQKRILVYKPVASELHIVCHQKGKHQRGSESKYMSKYNQEFAMA